MGSPVQADWKDGTDLGGGIRGGGWDSGLYRVSIPDFTFAGLGPAGSGGCGVAQCDRLSVVAAACA